MTKILSDSINLLSFKHLSIFSWCLAKNKIRNARTFGMLSLRVCEILNSDNNITVEIPEIKSSEGKNENLDDNSEDLKSDLELEMNDDKDGFENSCQKIEIKSITPHSLTLILWAFGKSKMRDDDLFELASDIIIKNFEKFSAKMLNIILYSYKSLKIKSKVF